MAASTNMSFIPACAVPFTTCINILSWFNYKQNAEALGSSPSLEPIFWYLSHGRDLINAWVGEVIALQLAVVTDLFSSTWRMQGEHFPIYGVLYYNKKQKNIFQHVEGCRDGSVKKPQKLGVGMAVHRKDRACKHCTNNLLHTSFFMDKWTFPEHNKKNVGM